MTQKKLPRDFAGLVFYVLGWIIGLVFKAVFYSSRFILTGIYKGFKRDQFNRRLRIASQKVASDNPQIRALGREEFRFLAAGIGLTDANWHQSVKLRRRVFETLKRVSEEAVTGGDYNQIEAGAWIDETCRLLFTNFDRNLLTAETKPIKKRKYRLSRTRTLETPATESKNQSLANNSKPADNPSAIAGKTSYVTSRLPNIQNLNVENFATQQASDWASDERSSPEEQ